MIDNNDMTDLSTALLRVGCSAEQIGDAFKTIMERLRSSQESFELVTGTDTGNTKVPHEIFEPNCQDTILVKKDEYYSLLKDSAKLAALEAGGVDSWSWYGDSLDEEYALAIQEIEEMEHNGIN